jgi:Domain of unknown function (DUF4252)
MKPIIAAASLTLLVSSDALAQQFQIPDRIEQLAPKARESVNITLDGPLLQLAGQFMGANEQQVKQLISNLKAIHVRNFEFDREGQFSEADVEPVRAQLRSGWSRIVDTREDGEHVEIYVKRDKEQLDGLVLISAERKELSIVHIDGPIDLRQLSLLGGHLGIPAGVVPNIGDGSSRPAPEPRPAPQGRTPY